MSNCLRSWALIVLAAVAAGPVLDATAADGPTFTRKEDVIYGRKFGTALTMDVFTPKEKANGIGVVFAVSGGWFSSHEGIPIGFITPLTDRGYTVFAVVHGSQPKFTIPEVLQDMNRALRFIRHHAKDYNVDPDRLGIYGGSAGGHLSLMQGAAGDLGNPKANDPVDRESSRVQAVACFFPPTDFLNYGKAGVHAIGAGILDGFPAPFDFREYVPAKRKFVAVVDPAEIVATARRISPAYHASADDPPTLILHGDADNLVPIQQAELMVEKLKRAGVEAKLVVKPGAGHGWPGIDKDIRQFADWFDAHLKDRDRSASSAALPSPWEHRDIGDVSVKGDARDADGTFVITGTLDIWGKADGFHYVYQTMEGDGAIVARVTALQDTNVHAKAGVMVRESLEAGARHATMVDTPADGTQFLRRFETGEVTKNTNPGIDRGKLPRWLKLVRKGDEFSAFESADGESWTLAGTDTVKMPAKVHVGLVASSHQQDVTNTSTLDHVAITPDKKEGSR
ncbi:MAG TPA: prolyl oligopeptidase family serine peptidase [Isosphaeraceae bacterium]|jgi:acetyl esterase/lipase|nr:prolyl oligopeptidase family serine peptidase [Isosphaeraceae bacterium]